MALNQAQIIREPKSARRPHGSGDGEVDLRQKLPAKIQNRRAEMPDGFLFFSISVQL